MATLRFSRTKPSRKYSNCCYILKKTKCRKVEKQRFFSSSLSKRMCPRLDFWHYYHFLPIILGEFTLIGFVIGYGLVLVPTITRFVGKTIYYDVLCTGLRLLPAFIAYFINRLFKLATLVKVAFLWINRVSRDSEILANSL